MKKILLFLFLLIVFIPKNLFANEEKLRVALVDDLLPLEFYDENNQPSGVLADYWRVVAKSMNKEIEFVKYNVKDSVEAVKNGDVDFHAGLVYTIEREKFLDYSVPIYQISNVIIQKEGNKKRDFADFDGSKVAMIEDSFYCRYMESYHKGIEVVKVKTEKEAFDAVYNKEVEAFFADNHVLISLLTKEENIGKFEVIEEELPSVYIYGVAKNNSPILEKLNNAIKKIPIEKFREIEGKWIALERDRFFSHGNFYDNKLNFNHEQKNWLVKNKRVKMGIYKDAPPYEYVDKRGTHKGITSSYKDILEDNLGVKFDLFVYDDLDKMKTDLKTKKIDVMSSVSGDDFIEGNMYKSKDIYRSSLGIFAKDNISYIDSVFDIKDKKIAVIRNSSTYKTISKDIEKINFVFFENSNEALQSLNRGDVDFYIGDVFYTKYSLYSNEIKDIKLISPTKYPSYGFVYVTMNKNKVLIDMIDNIIDLVPEHVKFDIKKKWTLNSNAISDKDVKKFVVFINTILVVFLIILLFVTVKNALLRSEIRKNKQSEKILKASEQSYRMLLDKAPFPIFLYEKTIITYANQAFCDLVSMPLNRILSADFISFLDRSERAEVKKKILRDDDFYEDVERKIIDALGYAKYVNIKTVKVNTPNGDKKIAMFVDVTNRIKAEKEKDILKEQLNHSQKMDSIGKLAGGVAHDFNNMLAGINGAAELLSIKIEDDNPLNRYVEIILNACKKASTLTSQMLMFSRKKNISLEYIDAHSVINESMVLLEHGISSEIKITRDLKAKKSAIFGDASQVQNLILNLCFNAKDAMKKGGKITIGTRNVFLDKSYIQKCFLKANEGEYIELSVEDNGTGIKPELIDRIFEPFFTTKDVGKGTGLGLSAVYGIVKNHSGTIFLNTTVGKGSKFSIYIPILANDVSEPIKVETSKNENVEGKVMIVDDEEILLATSADIIQSLGCEAIAVLDSTKALSIYKEHDDIDLVILDVIMPKKSGVELYHELIKINKDIKVIFVSGYSRNNNIEEIVEANPNVGFMTKPYTILSLEKNIKEILEK